MQATFLLVLSTSSNLRKAHLLIVNISRAQAFSATGIACALFLYEISNYAKSLFIGNLNIEQP